MKTEDIEAEALKIDPRSRARLAGRLFQSLDDLLPSENDRIWAEAAERRAREIDAGSLTSWPAEEVFRDAKARI